MKTEKREITKIERFYYIPYYCFTNKYLKKLPKKFLFRIFRDFSKMKITKINDKLLVHSFIPPIPGKAFDNCLKAMLNHKDSLLNAHLSITNKCFYNCDYCSNEYKKGGEMSTEEVKGVIRKLQRKRLSVLAFTGGEPLLREDLTEIIRSVGEETVSYVFTSGQGLTEEKAGELKEAGLFGIVVSIDHFNEETNNKLRGKKGAFKIALNAIEISKKLGFYTMIQTVVRKETFNDLVENLRFFRKLGVDDVKILEIFPCGKVIGASDVVLNEEQRKKLVDIHFIANKSKELPKVTSYNYIESDKYMGCMAGYNTVYVDASGEVCPCDMTPISFGNIVEEDFEVIWKRLKEVFNKPGCGCFLRENSDKISRRFKGKFPLSYKDSHEICKNYCPKGTAEYFKLLG